MCGIAGWIARAEAAPDPEFLAAMNRTQAHRGPDGEGVFSATTRSGRHRVALGHRRLAIIDLATGDQPMYDASGRLAVVFNGEIYNFLDLRRELEGAGYRFRTSSDTEVLLHGWRAWGERMVERLRGMFAFALWDADTERLLLARDPFGKKPLYLHEAEGRVAFASEVKALLALPGVAVAADAGAVWNYLLYRYVPGPATLFRGVSKLPPGTYALWRDGRFESRRYYLPPDLTLLPGTAVPSDAVAGFLARLDQAVRIRMVSDVPYGAFLSGGIDSSAVVALMARHSARPVVTFSVGFREARFSELAHARAIAAQFKTEHHELEIEADHLVDELPKLIRFRDAPVAEPSDIPIYLLSRRASERVKMVLTGEGSDEILAGYPKHAFEPLVAAYQAVVPAGLHRSLIEPLIDALPFAFRR
ncbi:MAG TPA: asparagine synthase (glutamine-hydrolyzing), partial [Candidatus Cybelea sp.]|nr:asparagine synthase (glutamine-hydrolyzing) [Candidatus Cybelea sp.]